MLWWNCIAELQQKIRKSEPESSEWRLGLNLKFIFLSRSLGHTLKSFLLLLPEPYLIMTILPLHIVPLTIKVYNDNHRGTISMKLSHPSSRSHLKALVAATPVVVAVPCAPMRNPVTAGLRGLLRGRLNSRPFHYLGHNVTADGIDCRSEAKCGQVCFPLNAILITS
jgi:hypothetical protein